VRALARDLALALGTCGHLCALAARGERKLGLGDLTDFSLIAAARSGEPQARDTLLARLLPLAAALRHTPRVVVGRSGGGRRAPTGRALAPLRLAASVLPAEGSDRSRCWTRTAS